MVYYMVYYMKKLLLETALRPEAFRYLQEVEQFRTQWVVQTIQPEFYADLKKTTIITSAGASTRIEGATLSDVEIEKRLSGLTIRHIRDRDEAEVAGYIDCKRYIFEHAQDLPISEHTVRSLHQMMMAYLADSAIPQNQRGTYKNVPNSVVCVDHEHGTQEIVFETMPPGPQTEAAMRGLIEDYNQFIRDPNYADLEVIAAFVVTFLAIHPFRDGNGRLSRLLTDLCLLQRRYEFCQYTSHEKVIEDTKEQYYIALRQTQASIKTKPDLNPWFLYFLKVLQGQTNFLKEKLVLKKPGTLTALEGKVLDLIQRHQPATIGFLERESQMKRPTLKSILSRLKKEGVVSMEGERKGSRYWVKK